MNSDVDFSGLEPNLIQLNIISAPHKCLWQQKPLIRLQYIVVLNFVLSNFQDIIGRYSDSYGVIQV